MKKTLIIIALLSIGLFSYKSWEEKKYSVSFTQQQWQTRYNWIEIAKQQLKKSDLPAKDVLFVTDSLLGKFQQDLATQLEPQFTQAIDSTKKKK